MKTLGNILWFILGGLFSAIGLFLQTVLCFISIIFIPVGFQSLKLAKFFLWPMGKTVVKVNTTGFKTFCNIVWAILFGWENFLIFALMGLLFCVTIIGIPFGIQYFKVAQFIIFPLGHDIK